jgi:hypothetical protein
MVPTSSNNKIISLHLQQCNYNCPNSSVCYHRNKDISNNIITGTDKFRSYLTSYFKVHESICAFDKIYHTMMLNNCPNYNITISSDLLLAINSSLINYKNQVQISVYLNLVTIHKFKEFQKLYLIKDNESLYFAYELMNYETGKLHFLLDQKYVQNNYGNMLLKNIFTEFQKRKDPLQTLDTCFTSWIVNGHCPYDSNNYIDITYDSTIRKCPYSKEGHPIDITDFNLNDIDSWFKLDLKHDCIYKKIFTGELNGRIDKDSDIQNKTTNNGIGSGSKHMRRFSLRR